MLPLSGVWTNSRSLLVLRSSPSYHSSSLPIFETRRITSQNHKHGRAQSTQPECLLDPIYGLFLCSHHHLFGVDPVVCNHPFGEKLEKLTSTLFSKAAVACRSHHQDVLMRSMYHASMTDLVLAYFCDYCLRDRCSGRLCLRSDLDLLHCIGSDMFVRLQICPVFPRLDVDPLY